MKTKLGVVFGVCVALALFAVPAFAAETGAAAGRVFDLATNAGVEGVSVVARCSIEYDEDQPYSRVETTTGTDGSYTLKKLLADRYYGLSFGKPGYIVESRWQTSTVVGKTKRVSDIALCPIPTNHGVYRLTNETEQFLKRFLANSSVRPEHPLTYEPLPQAIYTKTPVPGKKDESTRELTLARETVIPQILHKHERTPGEPFMVLFERNERAPTVWPISEDGTTSGNRRFIAAPEGTLTKQALEIQSVNAQCFIVYSGSSLIGGDGYLSLGSGFSVFFVRSGGNILAFLFEVIDTVSGDKATRCRNILTIMRHEIAAFRQQNGRWPTRKEVGDFAIDMFNPLCARSECSTVDADALHLAKGATYTGEQEVVAWLYSPSTGDVWPATSSGNGEAGW